MQTRCEESSPAPRNLVSDHALRPHEPLMQGLEHIENVIIRFILALLDGFGDEFIEGCLLQSALLQKLFKQAIAVRLWLDTAVRVAPGSEYLLSQNGAPASNGISVPQASPASSVNPATYIFAPRRLHREAGRTA
jgi:hypothetical protein